MQESIKKNRFITDTLSLCVDTIKWTNCIYKIGIPLARFFFSWPAFKTFLWEKPDLNRFAMLIIILGITFMKSYNLHVYACADLEGGSGPPPPLEFAKLNIADITGNEKLVIFHICAVIRQTESILLKVGSPWKNFLDPRLYM